MTLQRIAGICFYIVITSAVAGGQPQSNTTGQRQYGPGTRVIERNESDGRKVVVETVEGLDIDGRLTALGEVVTETTRGPTSTQTRRDVFQINTDGRRRLSETNESRQDARPNGDTSAVHSTWVPDVNGHLLLRSRVVEETRSYAPDVVRTDTTLLLPGINEPLREAERIEYTTHRINPEVVRHESNHLVRDVNGQWKPVEIRRGEGRVIGASEHVEEETVQRPDLNGNLTVTETRVIRSSKTKEQEHVVIETYSPLTDVRGVDGRPPLSERIQRTTTATADGGRYTVEEVESRSRVSPNEPMRMIRRIVTTVSPTGTDQWVTRREIFELDINGRMRLVGVE